MNGLNFWIKLSWAVWLRRSTNAVMIIPTFLGKSRFRLRHDKGGKHGTCMLIISKNIQIYPCHTYAWITGIRLYLTDIMLCCRAEWAHSFSWNKFLDLTNLSLDFRVERLMIYILILSLPAPTPSPSHSFNLLPCCYLFLFNEMPFSILFPTIMLL